MIGAFGLSLLWATALVSLRVALGEEPGSLSVWPAPAALLVFATGLTVAVGSLLAQSAGRWMPALRVAFWQRAAALLSLMGLLAALSPDFKASAFTWGREPVVQAAAFALSVGFAVIAAVAMAGVVRDTRRASLLRVTLGLCAAALACTAMSRFAQASLSVNSFQIAGALLVGFAAYGLQPGVRMRALAATVCCVSLAMPWVQAAHFSIDAAVSAQAAPTEAKNVFFITVDTLRADALAEMPNVLSLAKGGLKYSTAFAPSPWTQPSFASMMTGLAPSRVGFGRGPGEVVDFTRSGGLSDEAETLAEFLAARGYVTTAVLANSFLKARYGFAAGFARYRHVSEAYGYRSFALVAAILVRENARRGSWRPDHADAVVDLALRELEAVIGRARPVFFWLHVIDPHGPYDAPGTDRRGVFSDELDLYRGGQVPSAEQLANVKRAYLDEVRFTDDQIGRFLDALRDAGQYENSLIVFTSDHGEELYDHKSFGHGARLYDDVIRVPLIVKLPAGRGAGSEIRDVVSLVGLGPTVVQAAGLGGIAQPDGSDASPLARADRSWMQARPDSPAAVALTESVNAFGDQEVPERKALRSERWTLIWTPKEDRLEVYDRISDPHELVEVSAEVSGWEDEAAQLRVWAEEMFAAAAALRREDAELDAETEQQLRALGYLQ